LLPSSLKVLEQHLVCAAHEHPLCLLYDEKYFGSGLNSSISSLKTRGHLSTDQSCDSSFQMWNYIGHEVSYQLCCLCLLSVVLVNKLLKLLYEYDFVLANFMGIICCRKCLHIQLVSVQWKM
jgi:hypothetical protein